MFKLLLFFPVFLFAGDFDFDKWLDFLNTFMTAPTWKAFIVIIGMIAMCIIYITKFFYNENKRREEAYQKHLEDTDTQNETTKKLQQDASSAFLENMETAWEQDYEYYKEKIEEKKYSAVLVKINPKHYEEIKSILYDETLTASERSSLIILKIKY